MNIALFAYDFPHKKTEDFLFRLNLYGYKPKIVIASPPKVLNLPKSILRDKYKHFSVIDPRFICEKLNIEYINLSHDSDKIVETIKEKKIDLGIISGARILKKSVLDLFKHGVLNLHPGLIPYNRGLNTAKWAIKLGLPQGISAHLIDEKVDAGKIISRYLIPLYSYDSLPEINLRLYEAELYALIKSIYSISKEEIPSFEYTHKHGFNKHHPPADEKIDESVSSAFNEYLKVWSNDINEGWRCVCGNLLGDFNDEKQCKCGRIFEPVGELLRLVKDING